MDGHGRPAGNRGVSTPSERLAQAIAERVVALVVDSLDVDGIVKRIDVNDIVQRMDVDAIVKRIDVADIARRIDVNDIAQRIDVDQLLENTELSGIISRSTTGVLTEFLNLLRSQVVRIDDTVERLTVAVTRRPRPASPRDLGARR